MRSYSLQIFLIWVTCMFIRVVRLNGASMNSGSLWNCSNAADFYGVDARLQQRDDWPSSPEGTIQIALPTIGDDEVSFRHVCYPKHSLEAYRQFSYLSHAFCRQLGFMTYSAWAETHLDDSVDEQPLPLQPSAFACLGYEQSLSQCRWSASPTVACTQVAAVKCHSCHKTIEDNEGIIVNPGYPYAYFYTLLCEWNILLPKDHYLVLIFKKMDLPLGRHTRCEDDTAHLEIIFASSASRNFRLCATETVKSLKIEDHQGKITIRFHSGIYFHPSTKGNINYGFSISYKVQKMAHSSQIAKAVIISSGLVAFFIVVGFCYACQRCFSGCHKRPDNNVPESDIDNQGKQKSEIFLKPPCTGRGDGYRLGCETLDWSQKKSDKPSSDSHVSLEDYASAKTPTEKLAIPDPGTYNMEKSKRFCRSKLRTILLSKFTPQSSESKTSDIPVKNKPSTLGFQIYRSVSSVSDVDDTNSCEVKNHSVTSVADIKSVFGSPGYNGSYIPSSPKNSPASPCNLPTIVVECIEHSDGAKS